MEVEQLIARKAKLEQDLRRLMTEFYDATGTVPEVHISWFIGDTIGYGVTTHLPEVEVSLRL